tara:strand:+ start:1496 stop:1666 length:171 start_codon:yes stop_codon:yes gene_type:complete
MKIIVTTLKKCKECGELKLTQHDLCRECRGTPNTTGDEKQRGFLRRILDDVKKKEE